MTPREGRRTAAPHASGRRAMVTPREGRRAASRTGREEHRVHPAEGQRESRPIWINVRGGGGRRHVAALHRSHSVIVVEDTGEFMEAESNKYLNQGDLSSLTKFSIVFATEALGNDQKSVQIPVM